MLSCCTQRKMKLKIQIIKNKALSKREKDTINQNRIKGFGKALISAMISHLNKTGESALGFTEKTEFFRKAGLKTKKELIKRFIYKNPQTGEETIDNEGDGIYYE